MHRAASVTLVLILTLVSVHASGDDVLPYAAGGWKYQQVASNDPLENQFFLEGFDDSPWPVGQAAFGTYSTICPIDQDVQTNWDADTDLLLRRLFAVDPAFDVTLYWAIDNDASIWVNGAFLVAVQHEGCPSYDDHSISIPANLLDDGPNLLAVLAHDRGAVSFFDLRIEGTPPVVPAEGGTWGGIKSLYSR